eukprot:Hpha_TRINITY_DN16169_c1_g5::TRINITY_DN16169_c1_g5_i1::g.4793::m.4793
MGGRVHYAVLRKLVWQSLSRTWHDLPADMWVTGRVGFLDADYSPFEDEGKIEVDLCYVSGGDATVVIKSWSAADLGYPVFRGWEHFAFQVTATADLTVAIRVRNIGDGIVNSAVFLDHVEVYKRQATVTYLPLPGTSFAFAQYHLYVGTAVWHLKDGKPTVSPGQFPHSGSSSFTVQVPGPFYVQAHAEACPITLPPVPPPP